MACDRIVDQKLICLTVKDQVALKELNSSEKTTPFSTIPVQLSQVVCLAWHIEPSLQMSRTKTIRQRNWETETLGRLLLFFPQKLRSQEVALLVHLLLQRR